MPMASQDPLPQAQDFLSLCEHCHKTTNEDLWLIDGEFICTECYEKCKPIHYHKQNYQKIELQYTESEIKWKGIRGWTRWGGANNSLYTITPEWYCQACQEKQTLDLPSYLIRIENQEYARICSVCLHTALERHVNNIFDLMGIVKEPHPDF